MAPRTVIRPAGDSSLPPAAAAADAAGKFGTAFGRDLAALPSPTADRLIKISGLCSVRSRRGAAVAPAVSDSRPDGQAAGRGGGAGGGGGGGGCGLAGEVNIADHPS